MTEFRTDSMRHIGMNRDAIREAVKSRLVIGQQYVMENGRDVAEDERKRVTVRCRLISFSRNVAVFKQIGKTFTETLTYQEIWKMLVEGTFK